MGKIKFLKNSPKNSVHYPYLGVLVIKIQILVSSDKYFGDTANVKFGRFTDFAEPENRPLVKRGTGERE